MKQILVYKTVPGLQIAVTVLSVLLLLSWTWPNRTRDAGSWSDGGGVVNRTQGAAEHRKAVIDRLYNGDAAQRHLQTLSLLDPENVPPFTHEAQRWIWDRQNPDPRNCSRQKYYLGDNIKKQGLGSSLHVSAVFLGHALQYERIFLWDPRGKHVGQEYVDPGCGRGESYSNWDCLFEPLSVCAAGNATRANSVYYEAFFNETGPGVGPIPWTHKRGPAVWDRRLRQHWSARGVNVTEEYLKVWWRAQAAAYIIRPNNHTMAKIRRLRMNPKLHNVWQYGKAATHLSVPYPLPPGTISMHVRMKLVVNGCRHGDKASEMQLVDFTTYVEAAEKLINENPLGLKRVALVSSEDPYVIHEASRLTRLDSGTSPDTSWVIYTSIVQRMNDGPQSQLEHFGTRSALTSQWLFQLYLALECDLWIGTRNSNWNRLIDEMRCTFTDKCSGIYVELGHKWEWTEYHWRKSMR